MQTETDDAEPTKEAVAGYVRQALSRLMRGNRDDWESDRLAELICKSVMRTTGTPSDPVGAPHDLEVKAGQTVYHMLRRRQERDCVLLTSDHGLHRRVSSPRRFAVLLCEHLEDVLRHAGVADDVRAAPSGIICIVTRRRSRVLREAGKIPCPQCTQWCKGTKGLWWHQQRSHSIEHSEASAVAALNANEFPVVPYDPFALQRLVHSAVEAPTLGPPSASTGPASKDDGQPDDDAFDCVRKDDLQGLIRHIRNGFDAGTEKDRNGSYLVHWAAGCGCLRILRFLVEDCSCDPEQPQRGKRSFVGRTPLHWSARNGHLDVVRYLVVTCKVNLELLTVDGTSAFCWAAWQGHLHVMEFLKNHGCDVQSSNKFGCNASLWSAQGPGGVDCMEWLLAAGVDLGTVNNNGHSIVHKAAQRGQMEVYAWCVDNVLHKIDIGRAMRLVGPDAEGQCPSDLAGVDGHRQVAIVAADVEMELTRRAGRLVQSVGAQGHGSGLQLPDWVTQPVDYPDPQSFRRDLYRWEPYAGMNRMRLQLI